MGVSSKRFQEGDVYLREDYFKVFFRYDSAAEKFYRKFMDNPGVEKEVHYSNGLLNEALQTGEEVTAEEYQAGRPGAPPGKSPNTEGDLDFSVATGTDLDVWVARFAFEEGQHPRDAGGRFAPAGGGADALSHELFSNGDYIFHRITDQNELDGATTDLFGRPLTNKEISNLVGAIDGATLRVYAAHMRVPIAGVASSITVEVEHPLYRQRREIIKDRDGKTIIRNKSFTAVPNAPYGMGTRITAKQVQTARALGVDRIETWAAGGPAESANNGYYTWPRLGYEMPLIGGTLDAAWAAGFEGAKTTIDLMRAPGGAKWWEKHGTGGLAKFDLDPDSASSQVLDNYLEERGVRLGGSAAFRSDMETWQEEAAFAFDEAEHPRDAAGKFATAAGGGADALSAAMFGSHKREFKVEDEEELLAAQEHLFGKAITNDEIADLVGAADGATLGIEAYYNYHASTESHITVEVDHPWYTQNRVICKSPAGELVIYNKSFEAEKDAPAGMGTRIIARQVQAARAMGVKRLETWGAGSFNGSMNGYYTWPRLGYVAELDYTQREMAREAGLGEVETTADVMRAPGGPAWWKRNGSAGVMKFDLDPDSVSSQALEYYLEEKGVKLS